MSAEPSESQEVTEALIPSIAAKVEPMEGGDSLAGSSSQDQLDQDQWPNKDATPAELPPVTPGASIPATDTDSSRDTTDTTGTRATTSPLSSPSPSNTAHGTADPFPFLSPILEPVAETYVEPVQLRPLSDDEEDLVPTLENLLAKTRPNPEPPKSQNQMPPRESPSPVKLEIKTPSIKLKSEERMRASGSATAPRAKIPPDCIFIDLSDSPPPEPARTHHPPTSLSPTKSKPSASQIRPKRKFTPSLPPSTAETPPSKRLKTLSGTVRPAHKHNVHWALDGSIVIQIQETKFKVHQSQLAKQSQWFSDLFEGNDKVASAKHVERSEDGSTPMYILSLPSLTARDFGRLLDALDRAITYVHEDPPFSRLAGILRAATILKFHDFRDWIVRLLEDRWSSSLTDLSKEAIGLATESIILARACDVPSILKRAMYELARRAGYGQNERDSGQGVATRDFLALVRAREELTAVWLKSISPYAPEFGTCAAAMAPAPASVPTPDAEPAPQPIPAACTTLDPLRSGEAQQKLVRESGIADDFLYDPLCGLQALIDSDWSAEGFCEACVGLRREVWTNTRERAWVDLDRWFGLEAT